MNWRDRIGSNPDILVGEPAIKGTRISVELVLGWLARGWTHEVLLESYPHLTNDDILACLGFAAQMLHDGQYVAADKGAA
jgi:uncharacterized protein (DUF433 family)